MPPIKSEEWNARYQSGETPWDSRLPSRELMQVLDQFAIAPGRAIELGCGSGTNCLALAQRGHQVLGLDFAADALQIARERAKEESLSISFQEADLCDLGTELPPADFLFDRGCYHCTRQVDLGGYLRTLEQITHEGSYYLVLAGNRDGSDEHGIPKVSASELTTELEPLFHIVQLRPFHFEDTGGNRGPLGWSCLMVRRAETLSMT